jgi:hypothetical protein
MLVSCATNSYGAGGRLLKKKISLDKFCSLLAKYVFPQEKRLLQKLNSEKIPANRMCIAHLF